MIGFIIRHPILSTAAAVIIALNFTDAPLSHAFEKANVSEVMGLDANASGLRDDVESWIQGLYPEAGRWCTINKRLYNNGLDSEISA